MERGALETAFDWMTDPSNLHIVSIMQTPYRVTQQLLYHASAGGAAQVPESARLNMNYSSEGNSEEESMINILDRKRYNKMAAARSQEEHANQPR